MSNLKHTKIGRISFILALILLIYFIIITMSDLMNPISFSAEKTSQISNVSNVSKVSKVIETQREILIMSGISTISFILGIIARFQKESKKILPTIAIIISGLFLIPVINGLIKVIFL